jgi:hypothetical protein
MRVGKGPQLRGHRFRVQQLQRRGDNLKNARLLFHHPNGRKLGWLHPELLYSGSPDDRTSPGDTIYNSSRFSLRCELSMMSPDPRMSTTASAFTRRSITGRHRSTKKNCRVFGRGYPRPKTRSSRLVPNFCVSPMGCSPKLSRYFDRPA